MIKTLMSCALLCIGTPSFALDTLTMDVANTTPQIVIQLPANPTTGYQWTVTNYDKTILRLAKSRYVASQAKRIGVGGSMIFIFTPINTQTLPDKTQLLFTYARSWESGSAMQKQVEIHFTRDFQ